jgi:hypothetical protein
MGKGLEGGGRDSRTVNTLGSEVSKQAVTDARDEAGFVPGAIPHHRETLARARLAVRKDRAVEPTLSFTTKEVCGCGWGLERK